MSTTTTNPSPTPANPVATIGADIDSFMPILSLINSLASTYAGNIYRKVSGAVESLATWDTSHPEIQEAVGMIAPVVSAVVPGSSAVVSTAVSAINLGQHVLGELGALMATDPTVQGPTPPASVPSVTVTAPSAPSS